MSAREFDWRGHEFIAANSAWDTGEFAPLEPEDEKLWELEARVMLMDPTCRCPNCLIYVKGYVRGCRMRERTRRFHEPCAGEAQRDV